MNTSTKSKVVISEGVVYTEKGPLLRFNNNIQPAMLLLELGYKITTPPGQADAVALKHRRAS